MLYGRPIRFIFTLHSDLCFVGLATCFCLYNPDVNFVCVGQELWDHKSQSAVSSGRPLPSPFHHPWRFTPSCSERYIVDTHVFCVWLVFVSFSWLATEGNTTKKRCIYFLLNSKCFIVYTFVFIFVECLLCSQQAKDNDKILSCVID